MNSQMQKFSYEIVRVINDACIHNPSITKAGIFGSYSRGEQTDESDIDILYEQSSKTDNYIEDYYGFRNYIENELPKAMKKHELNICFVTIEGLNSGIMKELNQPIIRSILDDVIWLFEK